MTKNKIYPQDMHEDNIFIHWLNDTSYYNNENIKDSRTVLKELANNKSHHLKERFLRIIHNR